MSYLLFLCYQLHCRQLFRRKCHWRLFQNGTIANTETSPIYSSTNTQYVCAFEMVVAVLVSLFDGAAAGLESSRGRAKHQSTN